MSNKTLKSALDAIGHLNFDQLLELQQGLKEKNIHLNVYQNPTPVAVAVVPLIKDNSHIGWLGLVRNVQPAKGKQTFPGGYVDKLETIEHSASRELKEEANIDIPSHYFQPFASKSTPANVVLIFCMSQALLNVDNIDWSFSNRETKEMVILSNKDFLGFPAHEDILRRLPYYSAEDIKQKIII